MTFKGTSAAPGSLSSSIPKKAWLLAYLKSTQQQQQQQQQHQQPQCPQNFKFE
jgi:hypothetical protein